MATEETGRIPCDIIGVICKAFSLLDSLPNLGLHFSFFSTLPLTFFQFQYFIYESHKEEASSVCVRMHAVLIWNPGSRSMFDGKWLWQAG